MAVVDLNINSPFMVVLAGDSPITPPHVDMKLVKHLPLDKRGCAVFFSACSFLIEAGEKLICS